MDKYLEALNRQKKRLIFLKSEKAVNKAGLFRDRKTISNLEQNVSLLNVRLMEVSSSLMIPMEYISLLNMRLKKHKGFKLYLHFLLKNYKIHIANGIIPRYSNVTTKYQDENQKLKKVGIRPFGSDWAQLQILRISHGLSMSAIFMYLLRADSVGFSESVSEFIVNAGIPNLPNLDFFGEINLTENGFYFERVFRYREWD